MNSVIILLLAFAVAIFGYRYYATYIDKNVIGADPKKITPSKMYMDGVDFMPTSKNILFGYQFKSVAGAAPVIGGITALQWGWLPAILWLFFGVLFIGWVHDYTAGMVSLRNEGQSLGGLSYRYVSPRARTILLSFIYFYLLLIAGAFGAIIANSLSALSSAPVGIIILTFAGIAAGQMIYRWRIDIIVTTVISVFIASAGIYLGTHYPSNMILGDLAGSKALWAVFALVFCYFSAVLPIWRFALPINYVAFYLVIFGLTGAIIGIFVGRPTINAPAFTQPVIEIGPIWPMLFVTIACGAISGWHSLVSTSGTAKQLESELDARPVLAGTMFVEMILGVVALLAAAAALPFSTYKEIMAGKGAGAVFAGGLSNLLGYIGLSPSIGKTLSTVIIVVLAITVMQLVVRFMRIATVELAGDKSPLLRNPYIVTFIAIFLAFILILTGWWQYLWVLFGGANQLMASLSLLIVSVWLISNKKKATFTLIPMTFMFITTICALIYTSYNLLKKVVWGEVKGEALAGNMIMGIVGFFLVIAALFLAKDGIKAIKKYRRS